MTAPASGGAHPAPPTTPAKAGTSVLAFDLDGTLVDSLPDLAYCLGWALESLGLRAPTEAETRAWVGDGVEELVRRALAAASAGSAAAASESATPAKRAAGALDAQDAAAPEVLVAPALDAFSKCYAEHLFVRSRLYPGARETLDALRARGVRLCCVTNKRLAYANALLEQAGLLDRFELVIGGDSVPEKKPSPLPLRAAAKRLGADPESAAFVGDSDHDMNAARAAGWRFIWASYGYRRIDPTERDAAFTIDALPELLEKLR